MREKGGENRFPLLVVDDSPFARKLIERALAPERYEIISAKTGEEALALFSAKLPNLVITDWVMPDLSGVELCERIRRDYADHLTYVILLTTISDKSKVVRGLNAGADDYLTKPFDADELVARIEAGRRIILLHREIEAKNRLLEQLALTDSLTELPNRRAIEHWANRQLSGAIRHDFPFWLVACDIDHFKTVNDTYGHDAGDKVLHKFAEILKLNTRQCDICGRIGGDEFLIVITHVKAEGVQLAVERIRRQVETQEFHFGDGGMHVTASFGIAGFEGQQPMDFDQMMVKADVALYSAKRKGRNCVHAPHTAEVRL